MDNEEDVILFFGGIFNSHGKPLWAQAKDLRPSPTGRPKWRPRVRMGRSGQNRGPTGRPIPKTDGRAVRDDPKPAQIWAGFGWPRTQRAGRSRPPLVLPWPACHRLILIFDRNKNILHLFLILILQPRAAVPCRRRGLLLGLRRPLPSAPGPAVDGLLGLRWRGPARPRH